MTLVNRRSRGRPGDDAPAAVTFATRQAQKPPARTARQPTPRYEKISKDFVESSPA